MFYTGICLKKHLLSQKSPTTWRTRQLEDGGFTRCILQSGIWPPHNLGRRLARKKQVLQEMLHVS